MYFHGHFRHAFLLKGDAKEEKKRQKKIQSVLCALMQLSIGR
jgi:hypothetical protein